MRSVRNPHENGSDFIKRIRHERKCSMQEASKRFQIVNLKTIIENANSLHEIKKAMIEFLDFVTNGVENWSFNAMCGDFAKANER